VDRSLRHLEQLQARRGRREVDLSIRGVVQAAARDAQRANRRLGQIIDLWHEVIPPDLTRHCAIVGLRSGSLQVEADSAAVVYELDRFLRDGGTDELRRRYRGTLMRVRVRLAS
jgi:hypothetical protein